MDPLIALFGFGVGVLVGMTGVGGGSLMTPLLILVFGVKPVLAVGTDLAYAAVTKTVGGWRHFRAGSVDMQLAGWMAVGSIPAALGGVVVLEWLHDRMGDDFDDTLIFMVGTAVLLTGLMTLARALLLPIPEDKERDTIDPFETRHKVAAVTLGLSVGFVLGVTSAGSGALIAVGLIMIFHLAPRRVVGTDVLHAAVLLWAAALAHLASGNIDWALMGSILLGSLPGVWIGSGLTAKVPVFWLRRVLGGVLVAAGIAMLGKVGQIVPALLAFTGVGIVVAGVLLMRHRSA